LIDGKEIPAYDYPAFVFEAQRTGRRRTFYQLIEPNDAVKKYGQRAIKGVIAIKTQLVSSTDASERSELKPNWPANLVLRSASVRQPPLLFVDGKEIQDGFENTDDFTMKSKGIDPQSIESLQV